jgi:hypothetical protein
MLSDKRPEDILFLDIETVPMASSFDLLDPSLQEHWDKKSRQFRKEDETPGDIYQRAGIYAEFGKIICISAGVICSRDPFALRLKSFYGDNEKSLLS